MNELPIVTPNNWIDEKRLLECIHCGLCLPACPTHVISGEEMPSPRGRLYLMRAVNEGRLSAKDDAMHEHEWSCLVCRACETACPSGVQFGYLMEQTREMLRKEEKPNLIKKFIYTKLLPSRKLLNLLQWSVAAMGSIGLTGPIRRLGRIVGKTIPKLGAAMRLMPSGVPFPQKRPDDYCQIGAKRGSVGILLGCVGDAVTSRINDATIRVLNRLGYQVKTIPNITCCGALQVHAGYREEAKKLAEHLIGEVLNANPDFYISNIAGCGAMLKDYDELFHGSRSETNAGQFRSKVRDISEFLGETSEADIAKLRVKRPITVGYHAACHLFHAQRITDEPMRLLASIKGITVIPLAENDLCCGSAGSYNIEQPKPSEALLKRKMSAIAQAEPDIVVTANAGCLMQLQMGIRESGKKTEVIHVIELVDRVMKENRNTK